MMTTEPIRLAIVGCGAITESGHLPAALRSPLIDVSALVDLRVENARRLAKQFALDCLVTDSLDAALSACHGVLIATPNHVHVSGATAALERGIPTLIEKPITTTYEDALRLCDLADRKGAFISVGYRSRFWKSVPLLKELIDSGYLGRIQSFSYKFGTRSTWAAVSGFGLSRSEAGGGALIDAHVIDKILYWFGEPQSFEFWDDSRGGVEGTCKAVMQFAGVSGAFQGTLLLSRTMEFDKRIVIKADRFECELDESPTANVTLRDPKSPGIRLDVHSAEDQPDKRTDFQLQLEEFARSIRHRGHLTIDGRFAARSVRLIGDMYAHRQQLPEPWLLRSTEMERAAV
jgi:predicted dehydrogenase